MNAEATATAAAPAAEQAAASAADALRIAARLPLAGFALDVDLALPARGITAVFGPSGSGKTTLLRVAAGLARAADARVAVGGEVWQDSARGIWLPPHRRALGMVFQHAALFPHLSVRGNLDFALRRVPPAQRRIALPQAIGLLGIGQLLQRRPAQLSGGERQRVAIARALAASPRLLLMDEPLAALDAPRKAQLLPYFARLVRELDLPMLYVSHSADEVAQLAHHIVLMQDGRAIAHGAAADMLAHPALAQGEAACAVLHGQATAADRRWGLLHVRVGQATLACALECALECAPDDGDASACGNGGCVDGGGHDGGAPPSVRIRVLARDVVVMPAVMPADAPVDVPPAGGVAHAAARLPATVIALHPEGRAHIRASLRLADGQTLLARTTARAAHALALRQGLPCLAEIRHASVLP